MTAPARVDRAALVRRALVELVGERGFRGTSMALVAERAGVATGTAYVHYESKDALIISAYREVKSELGAAGAAAVVPDDPPARRFRSMWRAVYGHLAAHPDRARFLIQVDASPYAGAAHGSVEQEPGALMDVATAPDMAALLEDLPLMVLYDLGLGPAVRLAASGEVIDDETLDRIAGACWRAITAG